MSFKTTKTLSLVLLSGCVVILLMIVFVFDELSSSHNEHKLNIDKAIVYRTTAQKQQVIVFTVHGKSYLSHHYDDKQTNIYHPDNHDNIFYGKNMVFICFNPQQSGIVHGTIIQGEFTSTSDTNIHYVINQPSQSTAIPRQKSCTIKAVALLACLLMILVFLYKQQPT